MMKPKASEAAYLSLPSLFFKKKKKKIWQTLVLLRGRKT